MPKKEEKEMADFRASVGRHLAMNEARNPFRFAAWLGSYFFSKWFRSPQKDFFEHYMDGRARRARNWREKNSDPLFGLPDEDYEWLESTFWIFSKAPFRHARVSMVKVQTKGPPSKEFRDIFLWLENKIPTIQRLVPDLLIAEAKPERDIECYGEANPERAAAAFLPANIFRIEFRDKDPVFWSINAHHPTEQDVYLTVEGSDEVITRAYLSM